MQVHPIANRIAAKGIEEKPPAADAHQDRHDPRLEGERFTADEPAEKRSGAKRRQERGDEARPDKNGASKKRRQDARSDQLQSHTQNSQAKDEEEQNRRHEAEDITRWH